MRNRSYTTSLQRSLVGSALAIFAFVSPAISQSTDGKSDRLDCPQVQYDAGSSMSPEAADQFVNKALECLSRSGPDDSTNRITFGSALPSDNFRDVVRIDFNNKGKPDRCTGVFVAFDTVLTAAHCACGDSYNIQVQLNDADGGDGNAFAALGVTNGPILFPGYSCVKPPSTQIGKDVALFKVSGVTPGQEETIVNIRDGSDETPQVFRLPEIRPAILVLSDRMLSALYVAGFGLTESGIVADKMRGTHVSILSRFCAAGRVRQSVCAMYREFVLSREGLSLGAPPTDSCGGDSGGPVYRVDTPFVPNGNNSTPSKKILVGLVSRPLLGVKHPFPRLCGGGGIYTAIGTRPVLNWLDANNVEYRFSSLLRGE